MNKLVQVTNEEIVTVSSREVAKMLDVQHKDLMKKMRMLEGKINGGKNSPVEFWVESSYKDAKGEMRKEYLVTKKGCEFLAHKSTGEKGVKFTIAYMEKFNELEKENKELKEKLTKEDELALLVYRGGVSAIVAHKELVTMETIKIKQVEEEKRRLLQLEHENKLRIERADRNRVITLTTLVDSLKDIMELPKLTTTIFNEWLETQNLGEFIKLQNEKRRSFVPNHRFYKWVSLEGYAFCGKTINKEKVKVAYSTNMLEKIVNEYQQSLRDFVKLQTL